VAGTGLKAFLCPREENSEVLLTQERFIRPRKKNVRRDLGLLRNKKNFAAAPLRVPEGERHVTEIYNSAAFLSLWFTYEQEGRSD